jgi:O-antigen/teichoic acid export membrane protein
MCLLLAGWVALSALGPVNYVLTMSGKEAFLWVGMAIGICIGGITAFVFIPKLGLLGAGISFNAMILSMNVVILPGARRILGFLPLGGLRL